MNSCLVILLRLSSLSCVYHIHLGKYFSLGIPREVYITREVYIEKSIIEKSVIEKSVI